VGPSPKVWRYVVHAPSLPYAPHPRNSDCGWSGARKCQGSTLLEHGRCSLIATKSCRTSTTKVQRLASRSNDPRSSLLSHLFNPFATKAIQKCSTTFACEGFYFFSPYHWILSSHAKIDAQVALNDWYANKFAPSNSTAIYAKFGHAVFLYFAYFISSPPILMPHKHQSAWGLLIIITNQHFSLIIWSTSYHHMVYWFINRNFACSSLLSWSINALFKLLCQV